MSVRDFNNEINFSFKKSYDNYYGHYMPKLGTYINGTGYGSESIAPNCGPLLIINEKRQRPTTGCTITFTYYDSYVSGWTSGLMLDNIRYWQKIYLTGASGHTGTITIQPSTREFSQQLFTGLVHHIVSVSGDDLYQDVSIFCLTDNGVKMLYGMNSETERELVDKIVHGYFISPPTCVYCNGEGYITGEVCPDCSGYRKVGLNASGYLLKQIGESFGVRKSDEDWTQFQYRVWAKKMMTLPTQSNIKTVLGEFLRIDTGEISIEQAYFPEAVWTVRFPISSLESYGIGDRIDVDSPFFQDVLNDITPAGINVIYAPYRELFSDGGSIHDYCHDLDPSTGVDIPPSGGFGFVMWADGWHQSFFGSSFAAEGSGIRFFGYDDNYDEDDGVTGRATTAITDWSGFFSGISTGTYSGYILRDLFYSGYCNTGWV